MSRLFSSGGQSLSFSISPSNEYSGLTFFRIDWCDFLAVQGTLKSLSPIPQFKKASLFSLLYCPARTFIHAYWKNHSSDYTGLCRQSAVPDFYCTVEVGSLWSLLVPPPRGRLLACYLVPCSWWGWEGSTILYSSVKLTMFCASGP